MTFKGPYLADAVANEFLKLSGGVTPMKLQKLVYYSHAWSLALFGVPLIKDRIEAWQYGPVIPTLYAEFSCYGSGVIKGMAQEVNEQGKVDSPEVPPDDHRTHALIKRIWEMLGPMSAIQLSNMSHSSHEPWSMVEKKRPGLAIPDSLIQSCFQKILTTSK